MTASTIRFVATPAVRKTLRSTTTAATREAHVASHSTGRALTNGALACALLAALASAQTQTRDLHGSGSNCRFGWAAAAVGDVDQDGHPDYAVGGYGYSGDKGLVRLFSGRGSVIRQWIGASAGDRLGNGLASLGDLDGDQRAELAITAQHKYVEVYRGSDGARQLRVLAPSTGTDFGHGLANIGDVDLQRGDDLAIGESFSNAERGAIHIVPGWLGVDVPNGLTIYTSDPRVRSVSGPDAGGRFGWSIVGLDDIDGDNVPDLAVGAPGHEASPTAVGRVHLISGGSLTILRTWEGVPGEDFGFALAAIPDVDGDRKKDLVVGAPAIQTQQAGSVRVFSTGSGALLQEIAGSSPSDGFGRSVDTIADVDGDRSADLLVGAMYHRLGQEDRAGRAVVVSGRTGRELFDWVGSKAGDNVGVTVVAIGDVNLDRRPDFLAGAYGWDSGSLTDRGLARVFTEFPIWTVRDTSGEFAGRIAAAGDVDADGFGDVLVSAKADSTNFQFGGMVEVISGRTGQMIRIHRGRRDYDEFGFAVAAAGDADGDGHGDYIIGAPHGGDARAELISGRTGTTIHSLSGDADSWFGYAVAGGRDLDGDGYDDVVVTAEQHSYLEAYSGRTGIRLFRIDGVRGTAVAMILDATGDGRPDLIVQGPTGILQLRSGNPSEGGRHIRSFSGRSSLVSFGETLADAGDVDGDGLSDFVAGERGSSGLAGQVYVIAASQSDPSRQLLHVISRSSPLRFPDAVASAGDFDGDGYDDVISDGVTGEYREVTVHSGHTGETLFWIDLPYLSSAPYDLNWLVAGIGDAGGDGCDDVLVAAPRPMAEGAVHCYTGRGLPDRPRVQIYGHACPAVDGRLPRIRQTGRSVLGGSYQIRLHTAPASAQGVLRIGLNRTAFDLGFISMPGCMMLTDSLIDVPKSTDPVGRAAQALAVPNDMVLVGAKFTFQWFVLAPGANPLGLVGSDGCEIEIGRD